MPFSINGFGTTIIGSRGDVGWGSYDAVEWVVAALMPIIPIGCLHTFDWNGNQYRSVPIRWSFGLIARTFVGRWLWGLGFVAVLAGIIAFVDRSGFNPLLLLIALGLVGVIVGAGVALHATARRDKSLRRVLGAVTIGSCDPANFTDDMLRQMAGNPRAIYQTDTYAEAAAVLFEKGSYAQAMWAARMCVAVEDAAQGEALTDRILRHPEVAEAIEAVRKDVNRWQELMLAGQDRGEPEEDASASRRYWSQTQGQTGGNDPRIQAEEDDRPSRRRQDEDY